MKEEMCVLPVQCKGCSKVFDLWYDLQRGEEGLGDEGVGTNRVLNKALSQSLCWRCRQKVMDRLQQRVDFVDAEFTVTFE